MFAGSAVFAADPIVPPACRAIAGPLWLSPTQEGVVIGKLPDGKPSQVQIIDAPEQLDVLVRLTGIAAIDSESGGWTVGPFASARVHADRENCTTEVRLQSRVVSRWSIDSIPRGAVVHSDVLTNENRKQRRLLTHATGNGPSDTHGDCVTIGAIESVQPTSDGLRFRSSGPLIPRIRSTQSSTAEGFAPVHQLTIDIPNAALDGVNRTSSWHNGPFRSMRISRYASASECGVRVRLEAVDQRSPAIILESGGWMVGTERVERAGSGPGGQGTAARPGTAALVDAQLSSASQDHHITSTSFVQMAAAQQFGNGSRAVATVGGSDVRRYVAAALQNVRVGSGSIFDVSGGDLSVGFGESANGDSTLVNALSFRGAGSIVHFSDGVSLQAFAGRAAPLTLLRRGDETLAEPSRDGGHMWGAQGGWTTRDRRFAAGGGWVESRPDGKLQRNLHISLSFRGQTELARLTLERSRVVEGDRTIIGNALTVEPSVDRKKVSLGGFVRLLSRDFRAPAAAGFFAGLRRSYGIYAGLRPTDHLSANVSLSQSKVFSLVDPTNVGTLQDSRSAALSYQLSSRMSIFAQTSQTSAQSDPGAFLHVDNISVTHGVGAAHRSGRWTTILTYSREAVRDRTVAGWTVLNQSRAEVDHALWTGGELEAHLEWSEFANKSQAGSRDLFNGGMRYRSAPVGMWTRDVEVGSSVIIDGYQRSRVWTASVGAQRAGGISSVAAGVHLGFQRVEIGEGAVRNAILLTMTSRGLFSSHDYDRRYVPPAGGMLPLSLAQPPSLFPTTLAVTVFEDANDNGVLDRGESRVTNFAVSIDGTEVASAAGRVTKEIEAGKHALALLAVEPPGSYLPGRFTQQEIVVAESTHDRVFFPVIPAGSLAGSIVVEGRSVDPKLLENITVRVHGRSTERTADSTQDGGFDLGVLPIGKYTVELDESSLPAELVAVEPNAVEVDIHRGETASVRLKVRRATARERIGGQALRLK